MADAALVVYSWAMESERETAKGLSPVASMTSRVAQLWREQGEEFLEHTHADVVADLTRLRETAPEEPELPVLADAQHRIAVGVESTVHRLSEWDHAVMQGLRAWREEPHFRGRRNRQQQLLDDVVDLRGGDTVVNLTSGDYRVEALPEGWCVKHHNHPAVAACRKCEQTFCDDFLLRPTADVVPLCLDCALVVSGIRRAHR